MIKTAGAILICFAGIGMGRSVCSQLRGQYATVRAFRDALFMMQQRISFYKTPLPQMLHEIAEGTSGRCAAFFSQAGKLLEENFERTAEAVLKQCFRDASYLGMPRYAIDSFERLLSSLGWMDGANQNEAIRLAVSEFTAHEARMREELERRGRCYLMLGVCCGIAAAIIVI